MLFPLPEMWNHVQAEVRLFMPVKYAYLIHASQGSHFDPRLPY